MGLKLPCVLLLTAALLAGCAGAPTESGSQPAPDQSPPPPAQSAAVSEPDAPSESFLVDDPDSPYPMAVESWTLDMDGDGEDELVELRAEKAYFGNESEPEKLFEGINGIRPYTLVVTKGETVYELPLGWEDSGDYISNPYYFSPEDSERTGACWTTDRSGNSVLALWFDTISAGGAGRIEVYAAAFQGNEPVLLPVPEYGVEAVLDEETMLTQVTVPETGYTETLDLNRWLTNYDKQMKEWNPDATPGPIYSEDGTLEWPAAPGQIDDFHYAESAEEGIVLRQYLYGTAHMDGMGDLVTTLSWEGGQPVVLKQEFEWYY